VFQQWCGINVIFNYAKDIFESAGYDISFVLKNIAWTGSVNMAFTFVALGVVDRGGRRPLMLFGAAGLAVIYTALALCYHAHVQGFPMLLLVLAAIACYSMSLAPVVWVVISEIFPNRIRGAAMAISVAALWLACFLLTYSFPALKAKFGPAGTFALYAAICVVGFIFIAFALPETKNKTLEQIERELVD
jgi:MFS family permease